MAASDAAHNYPGFEGNHIVDPGFHPILCHNIFRGLVTNHDDVHSDGACEPASDNAWTRA